MKEIELYTDGSCLNNPGRGGCAAILRYKDRVREVTAGYRLTTNNRMELMAVIAGLDALKEPCGVTVATDSQYVKNGMTSWLGKWKENGWVSSARAPVKNRDLWQRLDELCRRHEIRWRWVRGHAGDALNERCDKLARLAASGETLLEDTGFEG